MNKELTLLFRDRRSGNHSIERLFEAIEPVLAQSYEITKVTIPYRPSNLFNLLRNIIYARRNLQGIIHVTGDAQYLAGFLPCGKVVLTIHDCGYLMKLRGAKRWLFLWFWYRIPCWKAAIITTISQSTKDVLCREVGLSPSKIRIIDNCVTEKFERSQREFNFKCPRILQIGSGRHKNLDTLVKALAGLSCELMIVGKVSEEVRVDLERHKIHHCIEYDVSNARLRQIYGECDILFFASRHEGFGLPIIEAQSVGIPVITSTVYSMPDVARKGAILVHPESVTEIRKAICRIANDADLRASLVEAGLKNVQRFAVATVADEYIKVYKEITDQTL